MFVNRLTLKIVLTLLSALSTTGVALADVPANPGTLQKHQPNPQEKKLTDDAAKAIRGGNLSLATILLKNALLLDQNNSALHAQLGFVSFESGDLISAERELRQSRTDGAKDQDVLPMLLQVMTARKEEKDILNEFPDPAANDKSKLAATILRTRALAFQFGGDTSDAISSMDRSLAISRDVPGLLSRVQIAMLQSQAADAMKFTDQALALDPNNANALMMKAELFRMTDKNKALDIINGVLKAHPDATNAAIARIEILLETKQVDEAQKSDDALIAKYPNLPMAVFYKAVILGLKNVPRDGWRIAQSLSPEFIQSQARIAMGAAELAIGSGASESANAILTAYVTQNPGIVEPRVRAAALRLKMNNAKDALDMLQPLMDSKDPRVLELIALTYQKLGQKDNAEAYLRKASVAGAGNNNLSYQVALADLRQPNVATGMQEFLGAMKKDPSNMAAPAAAIEVLLQKSKFTEASTIAAQAQEAAPKDPAPDFFKGEISLAQGDKVASLAALNQSLQRNPKYLPSLYARAQIYVAQNDLAKATADLKQAQAVQPNNPASFIKLAEIAAIQKQPAQSIALLNQGIASAPKVAGTRVILARYQISLKQYKEAETTLKAALQVTPNDPQTLALLGQLQQGMGQNKDAIDTNKVLTQKYQSSGPAQALLASSLAASGDKAGAVVAFKRAVDLSPDVLQYRAALIDAQIRAGDTKGALDSAHGWSKDHKGADGPIMVAETLARLNRLPEAASVVQAAQTDTPDSRLAVLASQISMSSGDQNKAVAILKTWLGGHTTDIPVRVAYANALMHNGDNVTALAQYEIIVKTTTDDPNILNNVAWLVQDKDPSRALALASKAMQLAPNNPNIADTLGLIMIRKGDAQGALPILQHAHASSPTNGDISYHLALALNATGQKADAKKILQAAIGKSASFSTISDAKKLLQKL